MAKGWGWHLSNGLMGLFFGILLLVYQELSLLTLSVILGFWLLFKAAFLIGEAFELRRYGYGSGYVRKRVLLQPIKFISQSLDYILSSFNGLFIYLVITLII